MPLTTQLHRLLYVSSAHRKLSAPELEALLAVAQARNRLNEVTGALLYADGNFMQLLEGSRQPVLETFARIERNPLHHGLIVLINGAVGARQFGDWSMAYSQATWDQLAEVQKACRQSSDAAVGVLRGFALTTSRYRLGPRA